MGILKALRNTFSRSKGTEESAGLSTFDSSVLSADIKSKCKYGEFSSVDREVSICVFTTVF